MTLDLLAQLFLSLYPRLDSDRALVNMSEASRPRQVPTTINTTVTVNGSSPLVKMPVNTSLQFNPVSSGVTIMPLSGNEPSQMQLQKQLLDQLKKAGVSVLSSATQPKNAVPPQKGGQVRSATQPNATWLLGSATGSTQPKWSVPQSNTSATQPVSMQQRRSAAQRMRCAAQPTSVVQLPSAAQLPSATPTINLAQTMSTTQLIGQGSTIQPPRKYKFKVRVMSSTRNYETYILRDIEKEDLISPGQLRVELYRQFGQELISKDLNFGVGYMNGNSKVTIRSAADIDDIWRLSNNSKEEGIVLWCEKN